ncbi:MAG: hypothetical protein ACO1OT_08240 [Heyndrickxia sp.]
MNDGKQPFVIAIAAVSGGGKTTVTKLLNEKLGNSKALFFDDYDFDGPDDMHKWVENGADYNEWDLSPLIDDLELLRSESLEYIVLDFPFTYKNSQARELIDYSVFIDTPLDIALARRITRDFQNSSLEAVLFDMRNYLDNGRNAYLEMLNKIKPNSDIVVNGTLPLDEIVSVLFESIMNVEGF